MSLLYPILSFYEIEYKVIYKVIERTKHFCITSINIEKYIVMRMANA